MWRIPIFTWEMVATALLVLMAFPSLAAVFAMALIERHMGGHFFDPLYGGNPILYQHLFWFFGHPEVYVMILPYFGIVTEIIATFSRKPVFGYVGMVISAFAIAGLSLGVWAHHMFTTGAVSNPFFSAMSFLIAVPTGVKFVNWIGTMWKGSIEFSVPMLFAIGFLLNFLIGGITGVMVASPPLDYQAHDSYFIVQHFHYTLGGGSMFALFAALYFWFPKMFGIKLDERLGRWVFAFMFAGFNATFIPMGFMGMEGMARRVYTYPPTGHLALLNAIATAGRWLMAIGAILFFVDVAVSVYKRLPVPANPWGGYTLEWLTSSPPPEFNFEELPPIRSRRPVWDFIQSAPMRSFVGLFGFSAAFGLAVAIAYFFIAHEEGAGTALLALWRALSFAALYAVVAERDADLEGDCPNKRNEEVAGEDLGIFTTPLSNFDCGIGAGHDDGHAMVAPARNRRTYRDAALLLASRGRERSSLS